MIRTGERLMSSIEISALRVAERSRWNELWNAYQRFYGVELSAQVADSTWQRIHAARIHGFGARESTGRLAGIARSCGAKSGLHSVQLRTVSAQR
jgi:hypothetical protein